MVYPTTKQHPSRNLSRQRKRWGCFVRRRDSPTTTTQQDALLPHVESGLVCLVGATTENPYRSVNKALRSRCWILELEPISNKRIFQRCHQLGLPSVQTQHIRAHISNGDARRALPLWNVSRDCIRITHRSLTVQDSCDPDLLHDVTGDSHYDVTSAFIKCMGTAIRMRLSIDYQMTLEVRTQCSSQDGW